MPTSTHDLVILSPERPNSHDTFIHDMILCYLIVLPGKSAFRAGFRPDCYQESAEIGPPAGLRPAGGPISVLTRKQSKRNPARKPNFRPGSSIA
jgi:hypothetical protein